MPEESNKAENKETNQAGLNKTQKILVAGILVILVAIAVVGIYIYAMFNKSPIAEGGNYVIDQNNLTTVTSELQEKVAEGMIEVTMNTTWNFKSGNEPSYDAHVANVVTNHRPMFITVTLDDTGETIYTSSVMPLGTALKKIELEKQLSQGTYQATCLYNTLDEANTIVDSLALALTIVIES